MKWAKGTPSIDGYYWAYSYELDGWWFCQKLKADCFWFHTDNDWRLIPVKGPTKKIWDTFWWYKIEEPKLPDEELMAKWEEPVL